MKNFCPLVYELYFLYIPDAIERSEQIKGATLIPKRAVNVMEGEVNRLLVLIQNSIVPLPYIVPRRVSGYTVVRRGSYYTIGTYTEQYSPFVSYCSKGMS